MRILLLIFCVFAFTDVSSQANEFSSDIKNESHKDSLFYSDLSDKLTVKFLVTRRVNRFTISDSAGATPTHFVPNEAISFGFGFNYKIFGLSASFIPIQAKNNGNYGNTQRLDLQANLFSKRIGIDLRTSYYKGFYIDNASQLNSNIGDEIYKRPDISTFSFGTDMYYIFNGDEYSFRSVLTNTQWQKRSAGTFFAGLRFLYFNVEGDTILAPLGIVNNLDPNKYSKRITAYSAGVVGGYAYTFVFKKYFFISGAIGPSINVIGGNSTGLSGNNFEPRSRERLGFTLRAGTGFNSKKYFAGLSLFMDDSDLSFANLQHERQLFRLYAGIRFF